MKRYLVLFIGAFLFSQASAIAQELRIDTLYPIKIFTPSGIKAGSPVYVTYTLINSGASSISKGAVVKTHLMIQGQTALSSDSISGPYSTTKALKSGDTVHLATKMYLASGIKEPAKGSNVVIVIWPTGSVVATGPNTHKTVSIVYTSIAADDHIAGISLYPNPVKDIMRIQIEDKSISIKKAELTDMAGRKMNGWELHDNDLDISSFPAGSYILSLQLSNDDTGRYKILKK